ncbi:MAG: histidine triad nucleotide-binding protein [Candidatus Omnitrophota bacterium]
MLKDDCVFCKIVKKEIPSKIAYEDNKILAFEDAHPQAPIHILVIPKHHIEKLSDISEESMRIFGKLILTANMLAKAKGALDSGYRVVINCGKNAGQEVFHLHVHLLAGKVFGWPPG